MKPKTSLRVGLLLATVLMLLACGAPDVVPTIAGGTPGETPAATKAAAPSEQTSSGKAAVLPDSSAGLEDLKAYHAELQIKAVGSLDGQPFKRSTRVEITRAASGDFDNRIQSTDDKASLRLLALGGAYYRWSGEKSACQGSADPPGEDEVIEPAAMLLPLGEANRVGVETVNQVSAVHYRFDQSALPRFKTTGDTSGDVWVAEKGGYVLRYSLTAAGPQESSGKGLEVSQSYQYELIPDSPAPALPDGCAPVPMDLPVVDGARNVNRTGGLVTFDTGSNPRGVIDFYEQKLPGLGWKAETAGPAGEVSLPVYYDFTNGGLRLTLDLATNEDQTTAVALVIVDAAAQAAEPPHPTQTPSGPDGPLPTIDPAQSGLPGDIPLYPGATGLMNSGSFIAFTASDPLDTVADFYRKQMPENGWTITDENNPTDTVILALEKNGRKKFLTLTAQDKQVQVMFTDIN
jgi:hypothetical protein